MSIINLFDKGCSDVNTDRVKINYHGKKEVVFIITQDMDKLNFISEDETISFTLDRSDADDCEYAHLSLGLGI